MEQNKEPNETDPGLNATPTRDGGRHLIQQTLHRGMFETRQRCHSVGDRPAPGSDTVNQPGSATVNQSEMMMSEAQQDPPSQSYNKGHFDWQKVPEVRTKKRKLAPKTPSPDQLRTANRFSGLAVDSTEPNMADNQRDKRQPKPPPIILYGIEDLTQLTKLVEEVVHKEDYTFKVASKNQLIISTKSIEKYKIMIEHIRGKGLIGHTFTRKDERCPRFVIKHLHFSTPVQAIIEAIEETGNRVKGEIVTARKRGTKEPLNTFFVNVIPHENNKLIKEIKFIYHQRVLIEDPKKKTSIAQCTRCQQYGHTKNNCMRPYRCVKCAGPHKATMCPNDRNTPAVCSLCSGNHPANYKGCQVYKEILARKSQRTYKKQTVTKKQEETTISECLPLETNASGMPNRTNSRINKLTSTYSEAVKTKPNTPKTNSSHNNTATIHVDNSKSQRTHNSINNAYSRTSTSQEHKPNNNLEILMEKQAEKIDQLLQHMGTLMHLITVLINKIP